MARAKSDMKRVLSNNQTRVLGVMRQGVRVRQHLSVPGLWYVFPDGSERIVPHQISMSVAASRGLVMMSGHSGHMEYRITPRGEALHRKVTER